MGRILKKLFYCPAWAVACRKIEPDQTIFPDKNQEPFSVLLPTENEWYADSFCVSEQDKIYVFVEIMGRNGRLGTLGVTEFHNGKFSKVVEILREPFHLSYPNVFNHDNKYYMIPETNEANQVRLYECVDFPYKWKFKKILLDNLKVVDSSFLKIDKNKLIMFSHDIKDDKYKLRMFSIKLHDFNIEEIETYNSASDERPGGNPITICDKCFRVLQDCSVDYGVCLNIYEINNYNEFGFPNSEKFAGTITTNYLPLNTNKSFDRIHTLTRSNQYEAIDLLYNKFYLTKPFKKLKDKMFRG